MKVECFSSLSIVQAMPQFSGSSWRARPRSGLFVVRAYTNKPPGSSPSQRVAFPQRSRQQQQLTRQPQDRVPPTAGNRNHRNSIVKRKHQTKEQNSEVEEADCDCAPSPSADAQRRESNRVEEPSTSGRQSQSLAERLELAARHRSAKATGPPGAKGFVKPTKQSKAAGAVLPKNAKGWQAHRDWLLMSMEHGLLDDATYQKLAERLGLQDHWRPQAAVHTPSAAELLRVLLKTRGRAGHQGGIAQLHGAAEQISVLWRLGMREGDIGKLLDARIYVVELGVPTLQNKFRFLQDQVGLSNDDIVKLLAKFPRILEYKLEKTIQKHLDFFAKHGVAQEDWSKIVLRAPMLLELSIANTLEPRIKFLISYGHVAPSSVGKLISRHPQVLTCTEDGVRQRVDFLTTVGMQPDDIGKAVVAHPQILHYSVMAMERRVQYLLDIGMTKQQAAAAFTRLPQLFSLDVTNNLAPKFDYLVKQLGGGVDSVSTYPGYFSLSLANRIIPRHRFLETLYKPVPRPFPMNYLKCSDQKFAHEVAGSSLVRFELFRSQMLLRDRR